jgi:FkbM family methyltransferase
MRRAAAFHSGFLGDIVRGMRAALEKIGNSIRTHLTLFGVRGVLFRMLTCLPGVSNEFKAYVPQLCRSVVVRLGTTDVAAFEHVFVAREYDFSSAQEPSIIIDVGANVGLSAVFFSLKYPNAKVIAIEPEPDNFKVLKRNAEIFSGIVPLNVALWNSDGHVSIEYTSDGSWGTRVSNNCAPSSAFVRSAKLSTLLSELGIVHIDLLKVDAEGAECEIFEDAHPWIADVEVICAELHDRFRTGCSAAFEIATVGFPVRWRRGELFCVAREGAIARY